MTPTENETASMSDVSETAEIQGQARLRQFEQAQARLQEGVSQAMRYWENSIALGQNQLAAMMQSSKIMAAGLQEISKNLAETNKETIEQTVTFTKSMIGAKSVKEVSELQAGFMQATLTKGVAQTRDLQQAAVELAKEAARPITEAVSSSSKP